MGSQRGSRQREGRVEKAGGRHRALARYWRACLADAGLRQGCFTRGQVASQEHWLSAEELANGRVERRTVEALFADADESADEVQVHLRPVVARLRTSHGAWRGDRRPDHVAPVVSVALVSREDGGIRPVRTVVPRDVLEPLGEGSFAIGTVEALDAFLTRSLLPPGRGEEPHGRMWRQYREDCRRLRDAVAGGWPEGDDDYVVTGRGMIGIAGDAAATVRNILGLYDVILERKPKVPLLDAYAVTEKAGLREDAGPPHPFAGRPGHSTDEFPLADGQRDVLARLAGAEGAEILAVNGPPGTGKTTMLLSVIASEWVRAARAGGDPPVIVAASANNQAVTNIIDAFGRDFGHGEGPFAGRWLPCIGSFGFYLPAWRREGQASGRYQTEGFFERIETEEYVREAQAAYLEAAAGALPELEPGGVRTVVGALHARIEAGAGRLEDADRARRGMADARAAVARVLGSDPEAALAGIEADRDRLQRGDAANRKLLAAWKTYLAEEPLLLSLFGFIPAVARKRGLKAGRFLEGAGYAEDVATGLRIADVEPELRRRAAETRGRLDAADEGAKRARAALARLADARRTCAGALERIGVGDVDLEDVAAQERRADRGIRFRMFLLATHYWEGRWLLEMERLLPTIEEERRRTGRTTVEPRWRRRMMVTPCMVCTLAMLPAKMTVSRREGGGFVDDYLFNFVDLLIVEEAGQVLPEMAGAAFALAKTALVIGDARQIEPIPAIPGAVDIGNLVESGVLRDGVAEADVDRIEDLGVTSTAGSALRVAQAACRHHAKPELDRGLYLLEHRRCFDEIVGFCNALCYRGKLVPRRGPAPAGGIAGGAIPGPLAYLHVDGRCTVSGGSRRNPVEALTIAAWLARERGALEAEYGGTLEEAVAVVTPFGRQAREIEEACRASDIDVDGREGMTVGTIHALQGADRKVVIFSPCYSKHGDGTFIDRSTSMLNVAVSRAKDAFVVFGDMDVFATARAGSPRHRLGELLSARPGNAMRGGVVRRGDLAASDRDVQTLRDAREHDAFLLELLGRTDVARIAIVSPWIAVATMERAGILGALRAAAGRGVEIEVYVDPVLSGESAGESPEVGRADAVLAGMGIALTKVRRLHSKIVVADEALLAVGSFNWLSDRAGRYARHETSLVYRGSHLAHEIETLVESLDRRATGA